MRSSTMSQGGRLAAVIFAMTLAGCAVTPQPRPLAEGGSASLPQLMRLAEKSRQTGNRDVAANIYRKAIERYPDAAEPYAGLGDLILASGEAGDAVKAYRAALERRPGLRAARYGLGKALVASDRLSAAVAEFDALIDSGGRDHRPYLARGVAFDLMGRHTAAQASYRAGLRLAPNNVALRNNLGLSLALNEDYHGGMRVLEDLTRDPTAPARARQNLALVYGLAGKTQRAATTAGRDLPPGAVERNLAYYRTLRELRTPQTASAEKPAASAAETLAAAAPPGRPIQLASTVAMPGRLDARAPERPQASDKSGPAPAGGEVERAPARGQPDKEKLDDEGTAQRLAGTAPRAEAAAEDAGAPAATATLAARLAATMKPDAMAGATPRYWVQLGAYGAAGTGRSEWQRMQEAYPELIGGLPLSLQMAKVADKGTFHRVRTGPFNAKQAARQLCQALAARGEGCYVVRQGPGESAT